MVVFWFLGTPDRAFSPQMSMSGHVYAPLRYLEAVGGYPGLIRCPDHLAVNTKPCFRPKEARNSKNNDMHGDDSGNAGVNGGMTLGNP